MVETDVRIFALLDLLQSFSDQEREKENVLINPNSCNSTEKNTGRLLTA